MNQLKPLHDLVKELKYLGMAILYPILSEAVIRKADQLKKALEGKVLVDREDWEWVIEQVRETLEAFPTENGIKKFVELSDKYLPKEPPISKSMSKRLAIQKRGITK